MKRFITTGMVAFIAIIFSLETFCLSPLEPSDTTLTDSKLNELQIKRLKLQKMIKAEDAKRNRQIPGVSAESLEEMNDKQDSICLALRSELVDVTLEIKENTPTMTPPQLIQQVTDLINKKDEHPAKKD